MSASTNMLHSPTSDDTAYAWLEALTVTASGISAGAASYALGTLICRLVFNLRMSARQKASRKDVLPWCLTLSIAVAP